MSPERWLRIEELFHEARERSPEERDAFLAAACADDEVLRQEVASLLGQREGTLLRDGLAATAATAALITTPERGTHEGRALGPYVLGSLLGTGGMGEVYRARDAKLGRDVAVKILPVTMAGHPERLARFEREARVLAALNHPNIGAIYGFEEGAGLRGLVLELVEGTTLKDRLTAGALRVHDALAIAKQLAGALEAAHEKGIIHRDFKPANIQITPNGVVKVLDFGLAKIEAGEASGPGASTVLATGDGIVLGTVAYMSPEQARGLVVDARTDIWAFGCVLYEMLTGERPFPGDSSADVLGAITRAEPDWTRLPPDAPPRVVDVLQRCLRKDLDRRLHDIAGARIEIEEAMRDPVSGRSVPAPSALSGERRGAWRAAVAVLAAVVGLGLWMALPRMRPEPRGPARVSIELPSEASLAIGPRGRGSSVAVSPDGRHIAFAALSQGETRLYVRSLDALESAALSGTEGASNPVFSPDGRWIAFTAHNRLKKVAVEGGTVVPLTDVGEFAAQGAAWGPGDTIVFAALNPRARGLWRMNASGGRPVRVTTPREGERNHQWPHVLPDGKSVLYTIWNNSGFESGRIAVQSIQGGEPMVLVEGGSYGRVVKTDDRAYLVYAQLDGLMAAPFDLATVRLTGRAVPVLDGVLTNGSGGAHFSQSDNGLLAYVPGRNDELEKTLLWVDRAGTATEIATIPGMSFNYRLSPDARRIVRPSPQDAGRDLWIDDLERPGTPLRLTFGGSHDLPIWTPDGTRVIYSKGEPGANLFWRAADGSGDEERLTTSPNPQRAGSVSPDGATLAYVETAEGRGTDILLLPLQGKREPRFFLGTPFGELNPMISPDGRWLAYQSNESGRFEVYLTPFPGGGRRVPVSTGGGHFPLWSPDGRELYYRNVEPPQGGNMMVVSVDAPGSATEVGRPRVLFPSPYQGNGSVAPDGRFLLLKMTPQESPARVIQLVLNWFDDLESRVSQP